MWEIKGKDNTVKATIEAVEYNGKWMEQTYVTVTIESPEPIDFEIGDWLIYRDERFEINYDPGKIKSAPRYEKGDAFKYENVKFNSLADELTRCDFLDVVLNDNQLHFTGLPKFTFYGNVQDLANRMQANLDKTYGKNTWRIVVSPEYTDRTEINVSVDNPMKVQGALSILVNDFKAYYTIKGRTLTIGAAGVPAGHLFKYGESNGLYEIEQNAEADQAIVTRVRAYGSTRNLPHRYYNSLTGADGQKLIPDNMAVQNLMLPSFPYTTQDPYVDSPNIAKLGIREDTIFFDGSMEGLPEIYPSIEGMTAEQLKAAGVPCNATGALDEIVSAEQMTDNGVGEINEGGTQTTAKPATFKITLKDLGFDINDHLTTETATVSFKSGMLGGRDFEIVDCKKEGDNYILELNRVYDDGIKLWFPYASYNAKPGDKFELLHIGMPDVYIKAQSQYMLEKTEEWLSKNDYSRSIYAPKIDENFMARQHDEAMASGGKIKSLHDTLKEGMLLLFEDEDLNIDASIFIDSLTIKEGDGPIPTYKVVLKEEKTVGRLDKMQNQIDSLAAGKGQGGGYTAAQIRQMIEAYGGSRFLSKLKDDRTPYKLSTDKAFEVGRYVAGASGGIFGTDAQTGDSFAEMGRLFVRVKAYFETLTTIEAEALAGEQRITPGGGVKCTSVGEKGFVEVKKERPKTDDEGNPVLDKDGNPVMEEYTELVDNGIPEGIYRCHFLSEQDGEKTDTKIIAGDQAIAQMFNAKTGTSNKVSNHRYWRLVTGVSNDAYTDASGNHYGYIDLSKDDCETGSDIPQAGDSLVQFGNRTDTARQTAIVISTVAADAPSMKLYGGIGSGKTNAEHYSLSGKAIVSFGRDPVSGKVYFRLGADGESQYLDYSQDGGLSISGSLSVSSTVGDMTLVEFIKAHGGLNDDIRNFIEQALRGVQDQIDGVVENHFLNGAPTRENEPWAGWIATDTANGDTREQERHLGDLYFDNLTGLAYRFSKRADGTYFWNDKVDSATAAALAAAARAQDTADGKRRIFTSLPSPPYDEGDLWVNASYPPGTTPETRDPGNGRYYRDILRCFTPRESGAFSVRDWGLASNYTDDSALNAFIASYRETLKEIGTQIDGKAQTWRQATDPSADWTTAADKAMHKGDLWYCTADIPGTDFRKGTTWYWDGAAWEKQEIPDYVFDRIDGKADIFVSKPTNGYHADDLWFLEADYTLSGVAYEAGTLVVAIRDMGAAWSADDWEKKDRYTDDTKAEEAIARISRWAEDGVFSPPELTELEAEGRRIMQEMTSYIGRCEALKEHSEVVRAKEAYGDAYTVYLSKIEAALDATPDAAGCVAVPQGFTDAMEDYYTQRRYLEIAITRALKQTALNAAGGLEYLRNALAQDTHMEGGLIMTTLVSMGHTDKQGVRHTLGGMNGSWIESLGGKTIASWWGGGMIDRENLLSGQSLADAATSLVRMDGSGYLAGGNLTWDTRGNVVIGAGIEIGGSGGKTLGEVLNYINWINKIFVPERADGTETGWENAATEADRVRVAKSIYSVGTVSAFGIEAGAGTGGSGGGASALADLMDVSLSGLSVGQVLRYDGTKWVNETVREGGLDEAALGSYLVSRKYATQAWVQQQGYLTQHQSLANYVPWSMQSMATVNGTGHNPQFFNVEGESMIGGYGGYYSVINLGSYSGGNFRSQIAMPYQDSIADTDMFIRTANNTTWRAWRRVLTDGNYASVLDGRYYTKAEINAKDYIAVIDARKDTDTTKSWGAKRTDMKVRFFDVYDNGGPATYGNVMEIAGRANHWQPQLWFGGGEGSLRVRNRNYNSTEWCAWRTILDSSNYASIIGSSYVTLDTAQTITGAKSFSSDVTIQQAVNTYGSRLRLLENSAFQGAYIGYDGADNVLRIGVHELKDTDLAHDTDSILVARADGSITFKKGVAAEKAIKVYGEVGIWLTGKTAAAIMYRGLQPIDSSSSWWLYNMKSASGHVIAFGGLGDRIGFYTFLAGRTANGTDSSLLCDMPTGAWVTNKPFRAASFVKSGGTASQLLMADGSVKELSTLDSAYVKKAGDTMTGSLYLNNANLVIRHPDTTGGTAKAVAFQDYDGTSTFSFGSFITNHSPVHAYIGWGSEPWTEGNCLAVSPGKFLYKNKIIWHAGNDGPGSGLDADLLDGVHASGFFKYNGWWNSSDSHNIDDATGMVFCYKSHGVPENWGVATTFESEKGNNYRSQLFHSGYTNRLYFRARSSDLGGWTAWREIAGLDSNVASATKLQTARTLTVGNAAKSFDGSANVAWSLAEIGAVNRAGDTMTGALNFANRTANKVGDDVYIGDFDRAGTLGLMGANGSTGLAFITKGSAWNDLAPRYSMSWDGTNMSASSTALFKNLNADLLDGYHASSFARGGTSAVTIPGGAEKWVRIAVASHYVFSGIITVVNTYNHFTTQGVSLVVHGGYRSATTISISQIGGYASLFKKARIVFPTASNDPYYIEVLVASLNGDNAIDISISNATRLTPVGAYTAGAVPSGYETKGITLVNGMAAAVFSGSLSGNASSATRLQGTYSLWGQSFYGNNVSGNMTGVGSISTSGSSYGNFTIYYGLASGEAMRIEPFNTSGAWLSSGITMGTNGNVKIGGTGSTAYKLDTNGTGRFTELLTATKGVQIGATADYGWYMAVGTRIAAGISAARGVNVGSLLVSNAWADHTKVPANGIYSKGSVRIGDGTFSYDSSASLLKSDKGLSVSGSLSSVAGSYKASLWADDDGGWGLGIYNTGKEYHIRHRRNTTTGITALELWATTVSIGASASGTAYKLDVYGATRVSSLRIGEATLSWDSAAGCLKVDQGFYATGALSSLGIGSGDISTAMGLSLVPTADVAYDIGSSSRRWATVYADGLKVSGSILPSSTTAEIGSKDSVQWRFHRGWFRDRLVVSDTAQYKDSPNTSTAIGTTLGAGYLELAMATPFIDFHRTGNSVAATDYHARIILTSTSLLEFQGASISAKGTVTSSDMRLKSVVGGVALTVSDIARAPLFVFDWRDGSGRDMGTSAQHWQGILPHAVRTLSDGTLAMSYGKTALAAAIALARRSEDHERRIAALEAKTA